MSISNISHTNIVTPENLRDQIENNAKPQDNTVASLFASLNQRDIRRTGLAAAERAVEKARRRTSDAAEVRAERKDMASQLLTALANLVGEVVAVAERHHARRAASSEASSDTIVQPSADLDAPAEPGRNTSARVMLESRRLRDVQPTARAGVRPSVRGYRPSVRR